MRIFFKIALLLAFASCGQNLRDKTPQLKDTFSAKTEHSSQDTNAVSNIEKYQVTNKTLETLPEVLKAFIPEDYSALNVTSGDLNLDQYPDIIMVLKWDGEDSASEDVEHPATRPLLILTGQADHSYRLAARNDNVVYCVDCGGMMGDPFMDVAISKGYFSIEHYGGSGWRWTRIITFKYSPADDYWYLHKDGGDSFHASDPNEVTTKVRTTKDFGKVSFDKFDIYDGQ